MDPKNHSLEKDVTFLFNYGISSVQPLVFCQLPVFFSIRTQMRYLVVKDLAFQKLLPILTTTIPPQ